MNVGQIPVYYNEYKTGRPIVGSGHTSKFVSKYLDVGNAPRFAFGYGLSYTTFKYSEIHLDTNILVRNGEIKASVTVKNIGQVNGKETVQMYIQDITASVVRPIKELKGFKKIELEPHQSEVVEFILTEKDLEFYTKDMIYAAEKGKFMLYIGTSSDNVKENTFEFV
ncbi:fibronectin type III-like domain-contianing protein [Niallia taxi]|uniref:fibronectin type III-like domain-contianing protein n=1 Tax=Niallia taxi TaxID=2499688 RepID=UPI00300909CA